MKIAHVNYFPRLYSFPGVERKLIFQAKAAFSQNYKIDFFILNSDIEQAEKNIYYKKIKFKKNISKSIEKKFFRYKIIDSLVPFEDYNYIILRYPLAFGFGFKLFYEKWGKKIITEHHSIEENELQYRFNSKILSKVCSFLEKKNKNYIFNKTAGMIGVTNEIILNNNKSLNRKAVISNGFKISSVKFSKRPAYSDEFKIVFVASLLSPWHGLDRIVKAAKKYLGPNKINIKIIGKINSSKDLLMLKNVLF